MKYELSFYPTTLDVLYDTARGAYVQKIAGMSSPVSNSAVGTTCRDLGTGDIISYAIGEFDIQSYSVSRPVDNLPLCMQQRVISINEGVRIRGEIVRR